MTNQPTNPEYTLGSYLADGGQPFELPPKVTLETEVIKGKKLRDCTGHEIIQLAYACDEYYQLIRQMTLIQIEVYENSEVEMEFDEVINSDEYLDRVEALTGKVLDIVDRYPGVLFGMYVP